MAMSADGDSQELSVALEILEAIVPPADEFTLILDLASGKIFAEVLHQDPSHMVARLHLRLFDILDRLKLYRKVLVLLVLLKI